MDIVLMPVFFLLNREKEPETQKEERLMEEKKKKKQEEKKKKEGAQKKAADQKTKVPEPTKTCSSQPQPAGTGTSTPTSTLSSSSNGKRAPAGGQQPAVSRYLPREVPPRFRQQEQKQLLKRGQPLPTGALTSASPTQAAGPAGVSPPPLPGAGAQQQPSKLQPGTPSVSSSLPGLQHISVSEMSQIAPPPCSCPPEGTAILTRIRVAVAT
ncbi:Trinucleotide repeat-containing protein 6B protein [Myotis davidii]|uniref:Trinucleotide repeat-containing protein 6B protein n=1 Tax=Myotis davidii TaxID=225400 RepID=L5MBY9_MYODS|nr:Trinucleotide repeat-containing protein 6B protein [Myotis davidii]